MQFSRAAILGLSATLVVATFFLGRALLGGSGDADFGAERDDSPAPTPRGFAPGAGSSAPAPAPATPQAGDVGGTPAAPHPPEPAPPAVARRAFSPPPAPPAFEPARFEGLVLDLDGRPVAATVRLWRLPDALLPGGGARQLVDEASAAAGETFALEAFDVGRHRLEATAADGATASREVGPASASALELRCGSKPAAAPPAAEARPLTGRVVRRGDESPVAGVRVVGRSIEAEDGVDDAGSFFAATTDADGAFAAAVPPGRWRVRAEPSDEERSAEVEAEPDGPPVRLSMERPWRIFGRAVDASGAPLRRWRLRTWFASPRGPTPGPSRTARSFDGGFELRATLTARVTAFLEAPGAPPVLLGEFDAAPGREFAIEPVRVDAGAVVWGVVVDAQGAPFAGARVRAIAAGAADRVVVADGEGTFVLEGVPRHAVALEAEHDDAVAPVRLPPTPPPTEAPLDVGAITLVRGGVLEGLVRTPDGAPDGAAVVQAIEAGDRRGPRRTKTAPTDSFGRYRLGGLAPGAWRVRTLKRSGTYAVDASDRGEAPPRIVEITPQGRTALDL